MENCPLHNTPCCNLKKIQMIDTVSGEQKYMSVCEKCFSIMSIDEIIKMVTGRSQQKVLRCKSCGSSANDIFKANRFGCGSCYSTFSQMAISFFDKCQVGLTHTGKRTTNKLSENASPQQILLLIKEAVQAENYELASELKKRLNKIPSAVTT